jgi:hypothetical protein
MVVSDSRVAVLGFRDMEGVPLHIRTRQVFETDHKVK